MGEVKQLLKEDVTWQMEDPVLLDNHHTAVKERSGGGGKEREVMQGKSTIYDLCQSPTYTLGNETWPCTHHHIIVVYSDDNDPWC